MLRSTKELESCAIGATDGPIGQVEDLYFDDDAWVLRYLVVDTGTWLSSRKVLISPMSVGKPDWEQRLLPVSISKEQVKNSPDIDTNKPVSRQHESDYLGYYGYPAYWGGVGLWGEGLYPAATLAATLAADAPQSFNDADMQRQRAEEARQESERHRNDDPHLRSCNAVVGYYIHATDGEVGHVEGFIVDDQTWAVRYLVVNTSNWWVGHPVLIAPQWITGVHWTDHTVSVNLTRDAVKSAPAYDSSAQLNREWEAGLYAHLERQAYWASRDDDASTQAKPSP